MDCLLTIGPSTHGSMESKVYHKNYIIDDYVWRSLNNLPVSLYFPPNIENHQASYDVNLNNVYIVPFIGR